MRCGERRDVKSVKRTLFIQVCVVLKRRTHVRIASYAEHTLRANRNLERWFVAMRLMSESAHGVYSRTDVRCVAAVVLTAKIFHGPPN